MNENINFCEILKGHEGETFYSPAFGNIKLNCIADVIYFESINGKVSFDIYPNGTYCSDGELIIFPSKDQRDWNKWIEEQNLKVPKTWNELVLSRKAHTCGCGIGIVEVVYDSSYDCYSESSIEKSALALLKIHQLIEVGYGGNITNDEWDNCYYTKHSIKYYNNSKKFKIILTSYCRSNIAFHTQEQAEEFLTYSENIELLKDYFMI